jgi:hypothetical protein
MSVQHSVTAFFGSFFDVGFALERKPHPGEKRLLCHLPEPWVSLERALTEASPGTLLIRIDTLMDRIDAKLVEEGMSFFTTCDREPNASSIARTQNL